jgi:hypothetical protein
MIKMIVAGSRAFVDYGFLKKQLDEFLSCLSDSDVTIISGMAKGADILAVRYAEEHHLPIIKMPADWIKHGRSAGYNRNLEMAKIATHLVAFWNGKSRGTKHMIDIAVLKGLTTKVIIVP